MRDMSQKPVEADVKRKFDFETVNCVSGTPPRFSQ